MRRVHISERVLRRRVGLVRGHATILGTRGMGGGRVDQVFGPWPTGGMCRAGRVSGADDARTMEFARS